MTQVNGPSTLMAHFLLATILRDRPAQEQFKAELAATRWLDAGGVVDGALAVALAARFGESPRLSDVRKVARKMVAQFRGSRLDADEAELVIRCALGENVSTADIPGNRLEGIKMLIFASIARDLKLSAAAVGDLLVRAEAWAAVRGFRPTLVSAKSANDG